MTDVKLPRPYVIWTLQRTGGTSLNQFLNRHSPYPKTQDEPFNERREFGEITRDWKATMDRDVLNERIAEVVALERNIKHCVEKVHFGVSHALWQATVEQNYLHLFLYRLDPVRRLLSMEYAERTRSWGRATVKPDGEDADAFDAPLPVDDLITHETRANEKLNRFWREIEKTGAPVFALSYEEIYAADDAVTDRALRAFFKCWGVDVSDAQMPEVIREIRGKGDQGTADRYSRFKGLDQLGERIADIPELIFRTTVFDTQNA